MIQFEFLRDPDLSPAIRHLLNQLRDLGALTVH